MSQWKKLLRAMVADRRPISYTYEEAANVLDKLNFTLHDGEGSHRKWWIELPDPAAKNGKRTVTIGLVQKGSGKLHRAYIDTMVQTLQENNLLPDGL